jgi:RNA polymerase sigma-70 factor (ECF subfamily)
MADDDIARIGYDTAAFDRFYRAHVEAVERFLSRRVDDPFLVADLTVEVFLAAIESARSSVVIRGRPLGWLYGVARNLMSAEFRRYDREKRAMTRLAGRAMVDDDSLAQLEERIDAEVRSRELYRAMDDLSEAERAVLELVALDGLSVREAADVLGIRLTAARLRLHRARGRLKSDLSVPTQVNRVSEATS